VLTDHVLLNQNKYTKHSEAIKRATHNRNYPMGLPLYAPAIPEERDRYQTGKVYGQRQTKLGFVHSVVALRETNNGGIVSPHDYDESDLPLLDHVGLYKVKILSAYEHADPNPKIREACQRVRPPIIVFEYCRNGSEPKIHAAINDSDV